MNITDWIDTEHWANQASISNRVASEIEKAMIDRVNSERLVVLENAFRRLTQERKSLEEKLGGACANLAGAEESARDREGIASMQTECRMLLAQESEVESIVELSTEARKPRRVRASTWSFISEMSGETTSTAPGMSRAGS